MLENEAKEEIYKALLRRQRDRARSVFASEANTHSFWSFHEQSRPSPIPSIDDNPFLIPGTGLYLVDFFGDREPIAFTRDTVNAGLTSLSCYRSVLLDSNLYNYLHWFVCGADETHEGDREQFAKLLALLNAWKCDYSALPYVLEQTAKNTAERASEFTQHTLRDTLFLHNMNEAVFAATGSLQLDPEKLQEQFGSPDADLDKHASEMLAALQPAAGHEHAFVTLYHLLLLQLIKIRRASPNPANRSSLMRLYMKYLRSTIGFTTARMNTVALLFFAGFLDSFIPWDPQRNPEKAARKILSSAWDLYIISMPEMVLAQGSDGLSMAPLAVFCTADQECARLAARFLIAEVHVGKGNYPEAMIGANITDVAPAYGGELPALEFELHDLYAEMRRLRRLGLIRPVRRQRLRHMVRDLSCELRL